MIVIVVAVVLYFTHVLVGFFMLDEVPPWVFWTWTAAGIIMLIVITAGGLVSP